MTDKQVVARNRRAFRDYAILERLEAGMALLGPEVKSLREGKGSLAEGYAAFQRGELFLLDMHIPEYKHRGYAPHEPLRPRKLLLHRRELRKLENAVTRRGFTLVPLQIYFLRGRAKVELGLAKGRKRFDKREAAKREEAKREARAAEGRKR
ncbi:MAG: SsrA-binding protein SmpB [Planctomycetota bacterium]|jgi:SsrA-binding protein